MLADAIRDCSRRGDLVLDPFAGSGSTLIANAPDAKRGSWNWIRIIATSSFAAGRSYR
jgi:hypothetical protein